MKTALSTILISFFLLLTVSLWGQLPDKAFWQITTRDGLSHNVVHSIAQDKEGFIWIGTFHGLNRWDGHQMQEFKWSLFDTLRLPNARINGVFPRQQDLLLYMYFPPHYVSYNPTKNIFQRRDTTWLRSTERQELSRFLPDDQFAYEVTGSNGKTWIHTTRGSQPHSILKRNNGEVLISSLKGIQIYDPEKDTILPLVVPLPQDKPASQPFMTMLLQEDTQGRIWMNTRGGFGFYDPQKDTLKLITPFLGFKSPDQFLFARDGAIWICHDGLLIYHPRTGAQEHYQHNPKVRNTLSSNRTMCILEDDGGRVWIGTDKGVNIWDPYQLNAGHIIHDPDEENSLSTNKINNVLETEAGLWIATGDGRLGLDFFNFNTGSFEKIPITDNSWGKWLTNFPEAQYGSTPMVKDYFGNQVFVDQLYLPKNPPATTKKYDRAANAFVPYKPDYLPGSLPPFCRPTPQFTRNGDQYFTGYHSSSDVAREYPVGLIRYQPEQGKMTRFLANPDHPDSLSTNYINRIIESSIDGTLWMGTAPGLERFFPEQGTFEHFSPDPNNPNALSAGNTGGLGMVEDAYYNIWITHNITGGLDLLPAEAIRKDSIYFRRFNTDNSKLPSNNIRGIALDGQKRVWVGSTTGLVRYDEQLEDFTVWPVSLEEDIHISYGPFPSRSGRFYIGSHFDGLFYFHPDSIRANTTPPRVHITDLTINNQPVPLRGMPGDTLDWETPLDSTVLFTEAIDLAYAQNDFALSFVALNYTYPERTRYKYKLEGYDDDWIETTPEDAKATYTNIPHGDYTFRVIACNSDGVWNEEGDTMQISISAPWWLTPWAYLGYLLLLGGLIAGIVRWRTYALQRQREELRARVNEQTQELKESNEQLRVAKEEALAAEASAKEANQAKSTFLSFVSHELRTPLTSIIGFANLNKRRLEEKLFPLIPKTDKKVERTMQQVSQNEAVIIQEGQRLADLINDLLDLAKIESGKIEWQMTDIRPHELIDRTVSATAGLFSQNPDLQLITEVDPDLPIITGDFDRLLQVLLNLVSNAVKFTDSGEVTLKVSPFGGGRGEDLLRTAATLPHPAGTPSEGGEQGLLFSVKDTGAGIPRKYQTKIFERFQQVDGQQEGKPKGTGLGLPICKEILEHHGGRIWVESEMGEGSTFYFTVPAGQTADKPKTTNA